VRNQASGVFRQGVSTADGSYFLAGVVPGVYELTTELSGFKKYQRKDVRLEVGKTSTVDVQLEVGGLAEQLTVSAESPIVDVTSKEVGGQISNTDLISLPSVNRNFIGFIGLLPGVVPSISTESFGSDSVSVNGQDARNNNYLVDGANNNDDVIGQRAGTQARTPIESIQEFQVLTSQFDAEFGRSTGAIVNAVTKQGGNAFHGSAFYFLQDAAYTKKDYFVEKNNLTKPDTKFQQLGGTIGGPLIKDKLHFFGSLERVLNDRASTINIPARPEFNASPTTEDRVWNWLVRLDHQINAKHSWNVRWLKELSPQKNQIIPDGARQVTQAAVARGKRHGPDRGRDVQLGVRQHQVQHAAGGLHARGRGVREPELQQQRPARRPAAAHAELPDLPGPAERRDAGARQRRLPVRRHVLLVHPGQPRRPQHPGRHPVRVRQRVLDRAGQLERHLYVPHRPSRSTPPTRARTPSACRSASPGPSEYTQKEHFWSVFAQDKWKVGPRLTLSLGARYDIENIPIPENDNPYIASPDDAPVDRNNISPRLGFAYDLNGNGKTVLRGGVGRFFDKSHLELISAFITSGYYSNSFTVNFPPTTPTPAPRRAALPTDPYLVNGPTVNRTLLNQQYPGGLAAAQHGHRQLRQP
jgi:hypothetical protein